MFVIRLLQPEDADAFVHLRIRMLTEAPWAFASSVEMDRGCKPELVRDSVTREGSAILGAFEGDALIGAAGLVRDEKPKRRHIATIWGVYVGPEARGQGVGRQLIETAISTARTWPDLAVLQLSVSERADTARRLYEQLGFTAWGVAADSLRVDGQSYSETYMQILL